MEFCSLSPPVTLRSVSVLHSQRRTVKLEESSESGHSRWLIPIQLPTATPVVDITSQSQHTFLLN